MIGRRYDASLTANYTTAIVANIHNYEGKMNRGIIF